MIKIVISVQDLVDAWGCECVYCGNKATARDHLTPQCLNGSHEVSNLAPVCRSCNSTKGGKTIEQFAGLEKAASVRAIAQKVALLYPNYSYVNSPKRSRSSEVKGMRIWLGSDTARILQLAQKRFGFAEGDEAALVLMALTNLMAGSVPATTTPLQHQEPT